MMSFKNFTVGLALVLASFVGSKAWAAGLTEKEVAVGINDVYVPGGFDTSSEVYVVTNGIFPNGCYRWKRAEVNHVDSFTHEVRTIAGVSQGMCLMVLVPFTKEVRLGKFEAGRHTLRFLNGDGTYLEKTMVVED
ncbi:MAG: hypothetical protein N2578_01030 [Bdellovibrionaceae bacterium]|nr:hypothetical protein [Pseudobdellovibrionaceae bacterium]